MLRTICVSRFFAWSLCLGLTSVQAWAVEKVNADEIVLLAEKQTRGNSFSADVTMTVSHDVGTPSLSTRSLSFKLWTSSTDKALVKVTAPSRDRGTGNLRIGMDLWQYLPNIDQLVRIPPSMMLQSWMGSDFTNDDLVRTSSLSRDYTHHFDRKENLQGEEVYVITCTPKAMWPTKVWP